AADRVRMRLAQPFEPVRDPLAELLVRGRGEEQVAGRPEPLPRQRRDRDGGRGHLALHVERSAAPDLAVAELARPRVDLPLRRVGKHGVRVREQHQARPLAPAAEARDEVRPLRLPRVELAFDAARLEVVAEELRRPGLVPRRVDGVRADQLLEEPDRLVPKRHRRVPRMRTYSRRSRPWPRNWTYSLPMCRRELGSSVSSQAFNGGTEAERI